MKQSDPLAWGLHDHEVRILAAAALAAAGLYGAFIALFGSAATVDCSINPEHCDDQAWLPPALAVATLLALVSIYRALPALWTAARTAERQRGPFRRFGVAWLAVLPWGLLGFWPAAVQVLYTALALPVLLILLLISRAAVALRSRSRAPS